MAISYGASNANANIALANGNVDKYADLWIKKVIPALVATGRWQIVGSGSGAGGLFQKKGQTAGLGGGDPWNVLTGAIGGSASLWNAGASSSSFSNYQAWVDVAELDGSGNETGRGFMIQRASSPNAGPSFTTYGAVVVRLTPFTTTASATSPGTFPTIWRYLGASGATAFLELNDNTGLNCNTSTDNWVNIGIEDSPGSKNVCSWFLYVHSRTNNLPVAAFFWCELDNVTTAEQHPLVVSGGSPTRVYGIAGDTTAGPFWFGASRMWAGSALDNANLTRIVGSPWGTIPSNIFAPLRNGVSVITRRPEVWTANGQIGVAKYMWVSPYNRAWPSTDHVATVPKAYVGQVLIPWAQGVAPFSGP